MYKNDKSVRLTHFAVRFCYVMLTLAAVTLPYLLTSGFFHFEILTQIKDYVIGPFYAVVPAGYVALFCLDRLLGNIRKSRVFDVQNVKLLRLISIACAYAGLVGLISFVVIMLKDFMFETMAVLSAGEFFVALIVNVVKNVFEKAIEIKEENDLTV